MLSALLQFAALCRAGGLRVSTSEVINAVRCLELIDFAPEEPIRWALRTNFVKEAKDRELFDKIYDLYFHTLQIGANDMRSRAGQESRGSPLFPTHSRRGPGGSSGHRTSGPQAAGSCCQAVSQKTLWNR